MQIEVVREDSNGEMVIAELPRTNFSVMWSLIESDLAVYVAFVSLVNVAQERIDGTVDHRGDFQITVDGTEVMLTTRSSAGVTSIKWFMRRKAV